MAVRKNLTIGVTVNLEHYENLRLEVNGEAESAMEADELVRFLDEILGRFGRADPATAERVDSYRRRVFSRLEAEPVCGGGVCSIPQEILSEVAPKKSDVPGNQEISPPGPARKDAETLICETCGGKVSPAEQKMSQLFTGKTLCRACIKKVQG
jgi:hypothetical protein